MIKKLMNHRIMKSSPVKLKKLFNMFTALFLISSLIEANIHGINLTVALGFGIAALMFNFSNQCETQILRMQVESFLSAKILIQQNEMENNNAKHDIEEKEANSGSS